MEARCSAMTAVKINSVLIDLKRNRLDKKGQPFFNEGK